MSEDALRKEKMAKIEWWKSQGIEPYGRKFSREPIVSLTAERKEQISIAGRIMTIRRHGKAAFCDVMDQSGKIQVYFKKDILGDVLFEKFRNLDVGDIIGIKGELFTTHTGQLTVLVRDFVLLSKIIGTLPEKWHGLKDVEIRYRKRYLDLIMNSQAQKVFETRIKILNLIRNFLNGVGFVEVETPMMHPIPGGAEARPFITHHNALDIDLYLRIAPELYLKKLLIGGMEKVYEINRSFRNEGISTLHNPEFTMLELYSAYDDYQEMMKLTEKLICYITQNIFDTNEIDFGDTKINFQSPWKKIYWEDCWKQLGIANWRDINSVKKAYSDLHLDTEGKQDLFELLDLLFKRMIEPKLIDPTFVMKFPVETSPLAKSWPQDPSMVERFELFIGGFEVANAYSELNDPVEQKKRFEQELQRPSERPKVIDEDYIEALEYGMPPAGGLGIGIDRLVMILTGCSSIRDVILFPLLRPRQ
ncbi:MAG TPA: lysine--tRNA ligase [bacterium]|nr:lysine--tRNA ligase [bacterium]HOL35767.1 lysine--tRNA ligase [bacterium]